MGSFAIDTPKKGLPVRRSISTKRRTFDPSDFFEVLVTKKLGFNLRHARRMYACMITTICYMQVHHDTHTITHDYACVSMYVGPYTHAPRIYTIRRACLDARVGH